jgi:hypothetical protein
MPSGSGGDVDVTIMFKCTENVILYFESFIKNDLDMLLQDEIVDK